MTTMDREGGAPTTVGQVVASEAAAVHDLAPDPVPEVEAVLAAEVEALDGLAPESLVEAEASLRVLLAEHDDVELTDGQSACLEGAADTLRSLTPEGRLVEGA